MLARENEVLRAEVQRLQDRNAVLEDALIATIPLPVEWRLTTSEERVLGVLVNRELATKESVMAALYGQFGRDEVEPKIVDVFVCKIRKKLSPFGIRIETVWGRGYQLAPEFRASLRRDQARKVAA